VTVYNIEDLRPELRRRSKRIKARIPVVVRLQDKKSLTEKTHTIVINAHGALLILAMQVSVNQFMVLENHSTRRELLCRVAHVGATFMGKTQVAVEFIRPDHEFWGITAIPKDWNSTKLSSPQQAVVKTRSRA
jgi:hypothetical protein